MPTPKMLRLLSVALFLMSMLGLRDRTTLAAGPADEARQIAALANFQGGLVIQVGCGDGKLTAALRLAENCTVQAVDTDPQRVDAARAAIRALGVYGPVSVIPWDGKQLPYVNHLATLVVCADPGAAPAAELERIVRPFGALAFKNNGRWMVTVKPQLPGTDQWPQHYHGADNNAVARDTVVGPPRRYQWLGEPEWQRSHLALPSVNSLLSAQGRLFTVEDLASAEHPALPGKQALVARDAYNGVILWRVMFADWHPIYIRDKETPVQIQRRAAAVDDVVYCTPGYTAPITVYDAATGAVRRDYPATAGTMEFLYDRGLLLAVTGDQDDVSAALQEDKHTALRDSLFERRAYGPIIKRPDEPRNQLLVIDAASGKTVWSLGTTEMQGYRGTSLAAIGQRVVFATRGELVCRERTTGKGLWRVPAPIDLKGPSGIAVALVLTEQHVYLADSASLRAFRLSDGKALWETPATINHHKPADVFVANGLVWAAAYDAATGRPAPKLGLGRSGVNGYDPETGKVVKQLDQEMTGPMGHDRCYRNRITTRYYINSATGGSDFLGLDAPLESPNPWIRSTCGIGPLPCNGLYYVGPPSCACCNSVMLNGMNALAADATAEGGPPKVERSGVAATAAATQRAVTILANPGVTLPSHPAPGPQDWPTYRHDNARSGATAAAVPAALAKRWEVKIGTRASATVIAAGLVYVADVDGHSVCALRVADGQIAWRYTTGGRVDSPPTYHQGLVLFGSRDGSAYGLRATDGELVWRFGPRESRTICAYGQPESAWPICGSLTVRDGLVYFAAGRNSFVDGGIYLYALDPQTGKVIHQRQMCGPYGEDGFPIENRDVVGGISIEGFKNDVFVAGQKQLFLRHQAFEPDLTPVKLQDVRDPHLIPSHGFLEAIPQHRSFWTIDTKLHYDIATGLGGVHGDILVVDGPRFYEVRGYQPGRTQAFDPRAEGYTLFAGTHGQAAMATAADDDEGEKKPAAARPKAKKSQRKWANSKTSAASTKLWTSAIPLTGKALVLAGDVLFVAGTPVAFPEDDLAKAYEGRMGGVLWAASAKTGDKLAQYPLDAPPAWDGLAAADGLLFLTLADGRVLCLGGK